MGCICIWGSARPGDRRHRFGNRQQYNKAKCGAGNAFPLPDRRKLPVSGRRQDFLDVYHKTQVVVLSSDAGSGRTACLDSRRVATSCCLVLELPDAFCATPRRFSLPPPTANEDRQRIYRPPLTISSLFSIFRFQTIGISSIRPFDYPRNVSHVRLRGVTERRNQPFVNTGAAS
ncbi:hypothetical protein BGZ61DRAFT_40940 [Ilyonectria robusta]|uniref:uncharacterized protein n=1 Tax=Ilyonectria robusta TaxID=1079257 RepID=UPI001E8CFB47|nr:uncharacterized protein BGZ61DRAFT_40940 [Ilyonectria robusta]KAH8688305.1 hypothetical protein BGZ61DRAFT_40940 [Ilyonectria robusta]